MARDPADASDASEGAESRVPYRRRPSSDQGNNPGRRAGAAHERQYAYEDRRSACRQLFEIHQPLQMPDAIGQGSVAMDGEIPVGTGIDAHRVYADAGDPALLDQPERRLA